MMNIPLARRLSLPYAVAWLAAASASAQAPVGPPPPSGKGAADTGVHELLPEIGRIGAEVAALGGASWNPYAVGRGAEVAGYIDLPLRRVPGGKISYEIFLGLSLARSDPYTFTDPVAYLANLASGASPSAALAGPPRAPYPVTVSARTRLRLLHVSPFGLKYTLTGWDRIRLRPYLNVGMDVLGAFTRAETDGAPPNLPFPTSATLGTPTGQGSFELGGHAAGGFEVRVAGGLSLNFEYRFTATSGANGRLHTVSSALGFHW